MGVGAGGNASARAPAASPLSPRVGSALVSTWLFIGIAFLVGAFVTVQVGTNARLKEALGEALPAVIISSALGVLVLVAITPIARIPWPSLARVGDAPWWAWLGGALGAAYAVATVLLARELGAATLTAAVVTGQLVCSVVLDHFGIVGFSEHTVSMGRVTGCLLMIAGIALISRF
jgi:bacterial/archaeal transporter family-2 protein